ncbi:MAG: hypothetical protein Q9O74_03430 [Planctomycetota bacterium]|nr:hypothetical protein [Planctomycetota bacterium]
MSNRGASVHAVVWQQPDGQPSRALADALDRQGIKSEAAGNPFEAFAKLLAARSRGVKGRVLVLVEPGALPDQESLRRAVERFDPDARCWAYEAAKNPKLTPLPHPLPPAEETPEVVVRPLHTDDRHMDGSMPRAVRSGSTGRPNLKLTGKAAEAPGETSGEVKSTTVEDTGDGHDQPESPRSVLTTEELEMLLADDQL